MQVNASERSEILREAAQVQEPRDRPGVHAVPLPHRPNRQSPPWNPVNCYAPDESPFEGFVDGAGI
jgi:hypothetical protein